MCKGKYVQIHSVRALLIVKPALHDAHCTAPFATQPAPACGTPFLHVQPLAATNHTRARNENAFMSEIYVRRNEYVRVHLVLVWSRANPVLQDAHFVAPLMGQFAPDSPKPFSHAQLFATKSKFMCGLWLWKA